MKLPEWTREPLVHFLAAGVLIFVLFGLRGAEVDPASRTIEIDREQQAQIALMFERTMSRSPTDAELDAQIERFVRDEVLYREALRLGLDQGDAVVRRRMAQKMDILASSRAETASPGEALLRSWYQDHSERFASEARYSFDQLWFTEEAAARTAAGQLGSTNEWQSLGQSISLLGSADAMPRAEVADRFGSLFLENLEQLETGDQWHGPVASGLGWHLVRLSARELGEVPPFETVASDVEDDWRTSTVAARKEEAYQILRDAYRVKIDE